MAVAMEESVARKLGKRELRRVDFEKFAEEKDLLREPERAAIFGKQIDQFVPEDGSATGLEDDDRSSGTN